MATIDRFLRQVSALTNKALFKEAITTPADEKRFDIAESHFALMIRADNNQEGAEQARTDARSNYFWTLVDFAKGTMSGPYIGTFVDRFEESVVRIGQQQGNRLNLPDVAQAQPVAQATANG